MGLETTQAVGTSAVPQPEVGACYGHGWRQMKKYVLEAFLATVVAVVVSLPGYVLLDVNRRMIGPPGTDIDTVFGSKERALRAAEDNGREEEVRIPVKCIWKGVLIKKTGKGY